MTVATIRRHIPVGSTGELIWELRQACEAKRVNVIGPPLAIYYDREFNPDKTDVEVCFRVTMAFVGDEEVRCRILPRGRLATCLHRGGYDTIGESYRRVIEWIDREGYRIIGPPREIYLKGPESGEAPSGYQTEIQFPIL